MKDMKKADEYALSIVPTPSKYDAPFYTTLDKYNDLIDAFEEGATASVNQYQNKLIEELESDKSTEDVRRIVARNIYAGEVGFKGYEESAKLIVQYFCNLIKSYQKQ